MRNRSRVGAVALVLLLTLMFAWHHAKTSAWDTTSSRGKLQRAAPDRALPAGSERQTSSGIERAEISYVVNPVLEPADTPECLDAKRRKSAKEEELASLSPLQLERLIEQEAQREAAEDQRRDAAASTCGNPYANEQCMTAKGFPPAETQLERETHQRTLDAAYEQHSHRLAARGDARSLLVAALLLPVDRSEHRVGFHGETHAPRGSQDAESLEPVQWLIAAQQAGRDDALVQWGVVMYPTFKLSQAEMARFTPAQSAARKRLLVLEPGNAAALLESGMGSEYPMRTRTRAVMSKAASLGEYRIPEQALEALMLDARDAMPLPVELRPALRFHGFRSYRDKDADVLCADHATLLWSVGLSWIPHDLQPLAPCTPPLEANAPTRKSCLAFAELVYQGGNFRERADAIAYVLNLGPEVAARDLWKQRDRTMRWRLANLRAGMKTLKPFEFGELHDRETRSGDDEFLSTELLRRAGIPLEPPPEWFPPAKS